MTEGQLKADLVKLARAQFPSFLIFRHEDRMTGGIPDISVTGNGGTSWWEAKYADPTFDCPGIQELTALRLAKQGKACFFVIYALIKKEKSVRIVHPSRLKEWMDTEAIPGYNHQYVVDVIRRVHS